WMNKTIMDAEIPDDILIVMIKRNDQVIVPKGSTEILEKDILVLSGNNLNEVALGK
ncbi:TrkA C-terminal domain-containing protein, partial [Clostridium paraputrificum]|uniref:TrkA C-terminal domain-containing protein n=1 Tax=Clostridium paraputrificum TaxID=29363 RepID=UPI00325BA009